MSHTLGISDVSYFGNCQQITMLAHVPTNQLVHAYCGHMYNTVCLRTQILSAMTRQATPSYIKVNCEFTVISRREDARLMRNRKFFYIVMMYFFIICIIHFMYISLWLHFCRLSEDVRITNVGPVNTKQYSPSLKSYCQYNDSEITKSRLQLRADNLTSELEKGRRIELEDRLSNDDNLSGEFSIFPHNQVYR